MAANPTSHKVIALISGGKDSFLSILQSQAQGHEIIALANLYPHADTGVEEDLNSHMYQTAGHSLVPFYEQALSIPLYRREIQYDTRQFTRDYDHTRIDIQLKDETEDLTELLKLVLLKHPNADAVCSGAVLSTYQRTRIESVCLRLGLKPLAYLWQMSFLQDLPETASIESRSSAYLDHVAELGLDARIVKVASGGLDESFLWQSLLDSKVRQRIKNAMRKFGGSVIGEGGEYETLVLSGPKELFKGHIQVLEGSLTTRIGDGGEAWIDITDNSAIHVSSENSQETESSLDTRVLQRNGEVTEAIDRHQVGVVGGLDSDLQRSVDSASWVPVMHISKSNSLLWINNLHNYGHHASCAKQCKDVVDQLTRILDSERLTAENLIFTTIVLRRMDDFQAVNAVYGTIFDAPIPAARVTIAAGNRIPQGVDILMSCVAYRGNLKHKEGLHVQSISYWAPANIGPYSQAVSVSLDDVTEFPKKVFIAGQIALAPETMQPLHVQENSVQDRFKAQAKLALRHATRIGAEMRVRWWSNITAFVCSDQEMGAFERASIAYRIWEETHYSLQERSSDNDQDDEEGGPDAWDLKYGGQGSYASFEEVDRSLPASSLCGRGIPKFVAVQVEDLPRNQTIEWQTSSIITGHVKSDLLAKVEDSFLYTTPQTTFEDQSHKSLVTIPCHRVWISSDAGLVEQTFVVI